MKLHTLIVALLFPTAAMASDVFLSRGAHGEASFSDFAVPHAVAVDIEVAQPAQGEAQAVRERTDAMLAVAAELESARVAREKILAERRAERRAAAARRVPEYVQPEEPRYVGFFPYGYRHNRPRPPLRPKPAQPPSVGKRFTSRSDH
jgi:uncharacterized protein YggE